MPKHALCRVRVQLSLACPWNVLAVARYMRLCKTKIAVETNSHHDVFGTRASFSGPHETLKVACSSCSPAPFCCGAQGENNCDNIPAVLQLYWKSLRWKFSPSIRANSFVVSVDYVLNESHQHVHNLIPRANKGPSLQAREAISKFCRVAAVSERVWSPGAYVIRVPESQWSTPLGRGLSWGCLMMALDLSRCHRSTRPH